MNSESVSPLDLDHKAFHTDLPPFRASHQITAQTPQPPTFIGVGTLQKSRFLKVLRKFLKLHRFHYKWVADYEYTLSLLDFGRCCELTKLLGG